MYLSTILSRLSELNIYLEARGTELKIKGVKENITQELIQQLKQHKQELLEYLHTNGAVNANNGALAGSERPSGRIIPVGANPENSYPLSSSQERLWVLSQSRELNIAYNIPVIYRFEGSLNRTAWCNGFSRLIDRHESLRTVFRYDEQGVVWQQIKTPEAGGFSIDYEDLRSRTEGEALVESRVTLAIMTPFDLAAGPLLRAGLYQLTDDKWVFSLVMHHIISDGWSMGVLVGELLTLYNAAIQHVDAVLSPLPVQYRDYAVWQRKELQGEALKAHRAWWLQQFEGELPVLELPVNKPRPPVKTYNGLTCRGSLNPSLTRKLKDFGHETGCTLFMSLLAGVNALLFRYTGQQDIVVGTPIAGREDVELENQVGLYINTLAIRTRIGDMESFRQLAEKIRETSVGAYQYQAYPLDVLAEELEIRKDGSRDTLFDVMITVQQTATGSPGQPVLTNLKVSPYDQLEYTVSKYDLTFNFVESGPGEALQLNIEYNSDLFWPSTIEQMFIHLDRLLAVMLANPAAPLCLADYLSPEERSLLLQAFNHGAENMLNDNTITGLFYEQAARFANRPAVIYNGKMHTYGELNALSNRFAIYLQQDLCVLPGEVVAISLERNEWMIIALLGILKCGAIYLPLDPDYPPERILYMMEDSACKVRIGEQEVKKFLNTKDNYPEEDIMSGNVPGDGAYIMYTSGSTGKPKGVLVEHRGVVRLVTSSHYVQVDKEDVFLNLSNFSFDGSVFDIYGALLNGAPLVIAEKESLLDPFYLSELICENKVTIFFVPTAFFNVLADSKAFQAHQVKYIFFGGERASFAHVKTFRRRHPSVCLVNGYGPTENTVFSTYEVIRELNEETGNIPIGKPVPHSQCYILNGPYTSFAAAGRQPEWRLCPIGVAGEICVGGAGLARGYLNQVALTAERFVENPFRPGERMYRTGDLGRWLADGTIEYLGRRDEQVKVRGYRIEPAEIERQLLSHEAIGGAVVIAWGAAGGDGTKELVAYVARQQGYHSTQDENDSLLLNEIRAYVKERLPAYMIPVYWVMMESIPLTLNGKVDRRQLPEPTGIAEAGAASYEAPRDETERRLAVLWQEVLARERIGVWDDFFALGGHSLKVTRLAGLIHREWGVSVELRELFKKTVLQEQARLIAQAEKVAFMHIPVAEPQQSYPVSSAQRRMWILSQFEGGNIAYNIPSVHVLEGSVNRRAFSEAMNDLVARHESLRTVLQEDEQGTIRQYIQPVKDSGFGLEYREGGEGELHAWVEALVRTPFSLEEGPLLRAGLYRLKEDRWVLVYVLHHIISDGWSMNVLIHEMLAGYERRVQGEAATLPVLRIQYKDYVCWQQAQLKRDGMSRLRLYWQHQLKGPLPVLHLPADRPRPAIKSYAGGTINYTIDALRNSALKTMVKFQGATLFMGLVAVVKALLYRYSDQEDMIVGTPVAGREHIDLEGQIGLYVNTVVLRTRVQGKESYRHLLKRVQEVTVDAYAHQAYPFDELVDALQLPRNRSRNILFDVMVVLQNTEGPAAMMREAPGGVRIGTYEGWGRGWDSGVSVFDLTFTFMEADEALVLSIEYNRDLFNSATVMRMAENLNGLLEAVTRQPDQPLDELTGMYGHVSPLAGCKPALIDDLDL